MIRKLLSLLWHGPFYENVKQLYCGECNSKNVTVHCRDCKQDFSYGEPNPA